MLFRKNLVRCFGDFFLSLEMTPLKLNWNAPGVQNRFLIECLNRHCLDRNSLEIEEVSFMIFVEVPNYYPIFYLTFNIGFWSSKSAAFVKR